MRITMTTGRLPLLSADQSMALVCHSPSAVASAASTRQQRICAADWRMALFSSGRQTRCQI
jgi:hypothetical protein